MASEQENQQVQDSHVLAKKGRKVMSLAQKMRVLEMLENGHTKSSVGRFFHVNESTIRTIKKNEEAIRASARSMGTPESLHESYSTRDTKLMTVEKNLHLWLQELRRQNKPISLCVTRQHASQKCRLQFQSEQKVLTFIASNKWLDNFRKRYGLCKEDLEAAAKYPAHLKQVIEENGYVPQQVFNADEAVLLWKRMPACTLIAKEEKKKKGFKPGQDKLKVLLCSNASGDFLIKPMLLHRFGNPCPLRRECQKHLSVFMRGNHKIWITENLFLDWFLKCFIPQVKVYLEQKNLEFKVLLILDTAPTDKRILINADPHVKVLSIPPNTTTLLQPMHLGVLKMFVLYYTHRVFNYLAGLRRETPELTVKEAWQKFSICNALTIVEESVREMKQSTLNGAWYKLWNEVVTESENSRLVVEEIENVVASAKHVGGEGFEDIKFSDIANLLDSHPQKIVEEYFIHGISSKVDQESECELTELKPPVHQPDDHEHSEGGDSPMEHLTYRDEARPSTCDGDLYATPVSKEELIPSASADADDDTSDDDTSDPGTSTDASEDENGAED